MIRIFLLFIATLSCLAQDSVYSLTFYAPQVVDGAGWQTTFTLTNSYDNPAAGRLFFYDGSGNPLSLSVRTEGGVQTVDSIGMVVRGKAITVIETTGESPVLRQGYAVFGYENTPGNGLNLLVTFRQRVPARPDFEAASSVVRAFTSRYGIAYDNTGGFSTALAMLHADSIAGDYLFAFYDEMGARIETTVVGLNPRQQSAISLPARFPQVAGRRGFLELSRIPPGGAIEPRTLNLALTVLRFNPTGPYSVVPALNLQ